MTKQLPLDVLVCGATGKQGGALTRALISRGHRVRALTRHAESPAAVALRQSGVRLFTGSYDDAASLERAAAGADAVFAMGIPWGEGGVEAETRQGIAVVDAAVKAGVKHLVYTSIASVNRHTGIPFFESKVPIEKRIAESGITHTIIGPVFFMENVGGPLLAPALREGKLAMPLPPGRKLQQIAVADIGGFAATVIENPGKYGGRRVDIASAELTGLEAADILSRAAGRKIEYVEVPLAEMRKFSDAYAAMFEWFDRVGYDADITQLRHEAPEAGWHSYESWAAEQDWKSLLG